MGFRHRFRFAPSLLALASPALAQLVPGSIADNNVSFAFQSFPTSPTAGVAAADFRTAGAAGQDHLASSWWYYRIDGDPREYAFHGGPGQGPCTALWSGEVAALVWDDAGQRGIAAQLVAAVHSSGPRAGVVVQRMTVTNMLPHSISLNLYAFADLNQCGVVVHGAAPNPDGFRHRIQPPPGCTVVGEVLAPDADRWQVAPPAQLRGLLENPTADPLAGTGLPAVSIDYAAAFQWENRMLAPGASFTALLLMAQDFSHSGCLGRATSSVYGQAQGGAHGLPTWASESKPLLGTTPHLRIANGLPGALPIALVGLGAANLPVPGFGTLLVDPAPGLATVSLSPFDAAGGSDTPFAIPNDASLCGLPVHWQGAFLDPTAPFGVAHTNGLAWLVGGFGVFCDCAGAWPVAPRTPCSPGQVLQTNNPGGVCVTAWICSFFRCNLTRQWRCDPGGAAWTLLAQWTGGCP